MKDKEEILAGEETAKVSEEAAQAETAKQSADDEAAKKRKSLYAKIIGFAVIVGISIGFAAFDINLATVGHDLFVRIFNIATSTSDESEEKQIVTYTTTPLEETALPTPEPSEEASAAPSETP